MDPTIEITDTITMDAFTGDAPVVGHFASDYEAWALAKPIYGKPKMRPDEPNLADWRDEKTGSTQTLRSAPGRRMCRSTCSSMRHPLRCRGTSSTP
jgi:hypothetical protein